MTKYKIIKTSKLMVWFVFEAFNEKQKCDIWKQTTTTEQNPFFSVPLNTHEIHVCETPSMHYKCNNKID